MFAIGGFFYIFMYTKNIIKKIESLHDIDQQSIQLYKSKKLSGLVLDKINLENTLILKEIIIKHGFPFKNKTSKKTYNSAFLIVQHSNDLAFMEKIRSIFSKSNDRQINKSDLGYLIDRINILKGLPQIYGTQYKNADSRQITFFDIKDSKNINKRRRKLGMETFDEYKKKISKNSE